MKFILVISILLLLPQLSNAFERDFFDVKNIAQIKIQTNYKELVKNKYDYLSKKSSHSVEGSLSYMGSSYNIKIQTRGKNRLDNCSNPPLKIKFSKKEIVGTAFKNSKKIKLVTQCHLFSNSEKSVC